MKREDEMGLYVNNIAMKYAYGLENVLLLLYSIYVYAFYGKLEYVIIYVILIQNIVFFSIKLMMSMRLSREENEK